MSLGGVARGQPGFNELHGSYDVQPDVYCYQSKRSAESDRISFGVPNFSTFHD